MSLSTELLKTLDEMKKEAEKSMSGLNKALDMNTPIMSRKCKINGYHAFINVNVNQSVTIIFDESSNTLSDKLFKNIETIKW